MRKFSFLLTIMIIMTYSFTGCTEDELNKGKDMVNDAKDAANAVESNRNNVTVIPVQGMTCQKCVNAITSEVTALEGVMSVVVDLDEKNVTVEHSSNVTIDDIKEGIMSAGYTPLDD